MDSYESQYEEYKRSLLLSHNFRSKLSEKYRNTQYAETSYINENGVLTKIGALSAVFGFCLSICWMDTHIAIRIISAMISVVCFFVALHIGSQFKEESGKSNFHSYEYYRHIEERVRSDKELEARKLVRDILDRQIDRDEFRKKYEELSKYDRFLEDLKNDFRFKESLLWQN